MTIKEIAEALGITYYAASQRIKRAKIKPICKDALYAENTIDLIKDVPGRGWKKGRPRKTDKE